MFNCLYTKCRASTPTKIGHCTYCHKDGHWKDDRDRFTGDKVVTCPILKNMKNERRNNIRKFNSNNFNTPKICVFVEEKKTKLEVQSDKMKNIAITRMASIFIKNMFDSFLKNWYDDLQKNINISMKNSLKDCGMFISKKKQTKKPKKTKNVNM